MSTPVVTPAGHVVEHDAPGTHFRWRHPTVTAATIDRNNSIRGLDRLVVRVVE